MAEHPLATMKKLDPEFMKHLEVKLPANSDIMIRASVP
jgi:hypothetical protein